MIVKKFEAAASAATTQFRELVREGICCETCGIVIAGKVPGKPRKCPECAHNLQAEDHPIEDMFGSEIQTGDTRFKDQAGRAVLFENAEDYLIEIGGVEFFKEIK